MSLFSIKNATILSDTSGNISLQRIEFYSNAITIIELPLDQVDKSVICYQKRQHKYDY